MELVDNTQLDTDLTSIANAIRTKGGTSAALAFPAGFVSAIAAIPSGGGSSWTKITSQEVAVNTTSGTAATAATINMGSSYYNKTQIIWVHVRDKSGLRNGYFYGADTFFLNYQKASGSTSTLSTMAIICFRGASATTYTAYTTQYGVYGYSINSTGQLTVRKRYSSNNSGTVNSTYKIDVYALDLPTGLSLFD